MATVLLWRGLGPSLAASVQPRVVAGMHVCVTVLCGVDVFDFFFFLIGFGSIVVTSRCPCLLSFQSFASTISFALSLLSCIIFNPTLHPLVLMC